MAFLHALDPERVFGADPLQRVLEYADQVVRSRAAQQPGDFLSLLGELDAAGELHRLREEVARG